MDARSNVPSRPQPALMPMAMPITVARTVDVPSSTTVGHTESPMTSHTGRENRVESTPVENGFFR